MTTMNTTIPRTKEQRTQLDRGQLNMFERRAAPELEQLTLKTMDVRRFKSLFGDHILLPYDNCSLLYVVIFIDAPIQCQNKSKEERLRKFIPNKLSSNMLYRLW